MYEQALDHEVEAVPSVDAADRLWMEKLGCVWPEAGDEADWLEHVNGLVKVGDTNMRNMSAVEHDRVRGQVIAARASFVDLFPKIRLDIIERSRRYSTGNPVDTGAKPSNIIDLQREFQMRGIDGLEIINAQPTVFVMTKRNIVLILDNLEAHGIDSALAANCGGGQFFTLAPESLSARLQPLYTAARTAGWQNYREKVNAFISEYADVLSYKPDKTRTLVRIIASTAIGSQLDKVTPAQVRGMYIEPLERTVVAYLRHGDVIRSIPGLRRQAYFVGGLDKKELLSIIAANVDDPVVKTYLKGYPIDDIEAAKEVHARHIRSRERRKGDYPLLYQGPSLLADPSLSIARAYAGVLENPDFNPEQEDSGEKYDIPRLTSEQQAEINRRITEADNDAVTAEAELRDLSVGHDPDEINMLVARKERVREVRRALVVRHLGMVLDIANTCSRVADMADVIGTANVALARFAMEEYNPASSGLTTFEEQAREAVYAALAGYHPKRVAPKKPPDSG